MNGVIDYADNMPMEVGHKVTSSSSIELIVNILCFVLLQYKVIDAEAFTT